MDFNEYIKIKKMVQIYDFYGEKFIKDDGHNAVWSARSLMLLNAMCELENEDKYPTSTDLSDIIDFCNENPEAKKIKDYLYILPRFDITMGNNQIDDTNNQHFFAVMSLQDLTNKKSKELNEECNFRFDGKYKLSKNEQFLYLNIIFNDVTLLLEKRLECRENSFKINGVMFVNVTLYELINIITYARYVKEITKENIQAAYYFLR